MQPKKFGVAEMMADNAGNSIPDRGGFDKWQQSPQYLAADSRIYSAQVQRSRSPDRLSRLPILCILIGRRFIRV